MKNLILALIILSITKLNACGPYYPEGESVRFSLFNGFSFYGNLYQKYKYSQHYYSENKLINTPEAHLFDENVNLWYQYLNGKIDKKSICNGLYQSNNRSIKKRKSGNAFISEMNKSENSEVRDYLKFAKKCEAFNGSIGFDYSWEKEEKSTNKNAIKAIKKSLELSQKTNNAFLKERYAYLAIRMSYYNDQNWRVKSIFENSFEKNKITPIYYWALHFKTLASKNSPRNNVDVANVFCNSIEKRDACDQSFDEKIPIEKMLYSSSNNEEKANVYCYLTATKTDFALSNLKKIYELNPNSETLLFLVEREINKIEDWILTPHYSNFNNSISNANYYSGYWMEEELFKVQNERIEKDRAYAEKVASWMKQTKFQSSGWKLLENYALLMSRKRNLSASINSIQPANEDEKRFKAMLLSLDNVQSSENPDLKNILVQETLQKEVNLNHNKFVFAIARELEFKKNTTDAAYLFSKLNNSEIYYEDEYYDEMKEVYWRPNGVQSSWFLNYYYDYFLYLNDAYSTEEMKNLISDLKESNKQNSSFETWKKENLTKEIDRLYDLLGTKFIREDKLNDALGAFEKVNDTLWKSEYYPFKTYLNSNPFYTNFYLEHSKTPVDTVVFTKESITRKLINLKSDFQSFSGNKKAYAAFHIANCYFNMTQYGNSWMMRRYAWSQNFLESPLVDNFEFFECRLAKKYYLEAYNSAISKQYKALSLRMAGRCENYKLQFDNRRNYDDDYEHKPLINSYYNKLENQFPEHYDELMSNCESFKTYYNSIN
ncbi:MAG: hypothetical protein ACKO7P_06900 [Bacteroidota bacterium]